MIRQRVSFVAMSLSVLGVLLGVGATGQESPRRAERIEAGGIENTFRLSPRLYSGGEPRGEKALKALRELGVKTIISVDGATPDVETAKRLGMRYVHLPIGYDGVPRDQAARIVQAMKTLPGPFYVHCHHGQHRGPAAAAICGMTTEGWTHDEAVAWMVQAGASPDYRGLYASAREFVPPTEDELRQVGDDLPERAEIPAIVDLMVRLDTHWDHLKAARAKGFKASDGLDPAHEALQVVEIFREAARLPEARDHGPVFLEQLASAEAQAASLQAALRSPINSADSEAAFTVVSKSCTACHAAHRDNPSAQRDDGSAPPTAADHQAGRGKAE